MADMRDLTVWDVLGEYADVHDELIASIETFASLLEDIQIALVDLEDEADEISAHLARCDRIFCRFKVKNPENIKS